MRTSNLTEREIFGIKINTQGQTQLAQVKSAITQTIVAKKREEVRDDLREAGDRARDRPGGYADRRARSTGKSIEELKKVTSCNRSARSRMKRSPSAKGKGKSRRFRREKYDGKGRGGSSNYPIVEVYNDGSKTQTSRMKVPPGYAVLDCGVAKSLCGAKLVALMAQTCAREVKRVGDKRETEAIDESCHFRGSGHQIVSSFMKLRVPGSIDGKEVSFAPSVTPGDIPPLVGNDHLIPWGSSIHLYPDECRLEIPPRGIDAKLHVTSSNHILVNLADVEGMEEPDYDVWTSKRGRDSEETGTESDMTEGTEDTIDPEEVLAKRSRRGVPRKPRVPREKPPPHERCSAVGKRVWQSSPLVSPTKTLNRDVAPIGDDIETIGESRADKWEMRKMKNLGKQKFPESE